MYNIENPIQYSFNKNFRSNVTTKGKVINKKNNENPYNQFSIISLKIINTKNIFINKIKILLTKLIVTHL